ncbi:MAG: MSMEG_0569 family flavin-dependent oxidoreductase [Pseudomonadota bacterium]
MYSQDHQSPHYPVVIVGAGQAGLSVSYRLSQQGIKHLVIDKGETMNAWKTKRWDSFTLVTPNWQCQLPDHAYAGGDPNGFMNREEIIDYLAGFEAKISAEVIEFTEVRRVHRLMPRGFQVITDRGAVYADQLVVATGAYHDPIYPSLSAQLPAEVMQLHSEQYRNPNQLPTGGTLVVGSGQSGAQIAEDLHLANRKVWLATGNAPRCARFYRGRDVVAWLAEMNYYDLPVHEHPLKEGARDKTNHYVTGRDGGRDIDLRRFALEGMELLGHFEDFDGRQLRFAPTLGDNLDAADAVYNSINLKIDRYIEQEGISAPAESRYNPCWRPDRERCQIPLATSGITSVIWSIGFTPNFDWLSVDVLDPRGYPRQARGVSECPGLYFIGLPWLYTWGSGRFSGVDRDACHLVEEIRERMAHLGDIKKTA